MNRSYQTRGVRYSDSLEGLLPSETMLLTYSASRSSSSSNPTSTSPTLSRKLRLLFYARKLEGSLASYERSGWEDQRSRPRSASPKHFPRLPTATGGPIIVCLDTSWSMVGPREQLAKSVVYECVRMASKQHRPCYVLAFSGRGNVAECDVSLAADKNGLLRLLEFFANSFHGGTDVTTPLQRALEMVETERDWASADVLLVTDGELSTPPVSDILMRKIRSFEVERGLCVYGLLVGRNDSLPLRSLCTDWDGAQDRVFNFLCDYDPLLKASQNFLESQRSLGYDPDPQPQLTPLPQKVVMRKSARAQSRLYAVPPSPYSVDLPYEQGLSISMMHSTTVITRDMIATESQVKCAVNEIMMNASVQSDLENKKLFREIYRKSVNADQANLNYKRISTAIEALKRGLVERDTEVRLVLLAAFCRCHMSLTVYRIPYTPHVTN